MRKHFPRISIIVFLVFVIILGACSQAITETPSTIDAMEPTATEEFTPVVTNDAKEMVIFSIEEDGYAHLFESIELTKPACNLQKNSYNEYWDCTL